MSPTSAVNGEVQEFCCRKTIVVVVVYWPRELIFTRNKLIVFTTSREVSRYVVFSRIMVERKIGMIRKFHCFFGYVYIPLLL